MGHRDTHRALGLDGGRPEGEDRRARRSSGERQWRPAMAGLIPAGERRNRAREVVVEVWGEGNQGFGGSGCGESRRAARFGRHERRRRRCSGSARHELENEGEEGGENGVGCREELSSSPHEFERDG